MMGLRSGRFYILGWILHLQSILTVLAQTIRKDTSLEMVESKIEGSCCFLKLKVM